jgi:hypothetical protein
MGYGAFFDEMCCHLSGFNKPKILEIGVEHGTITIPMVNWLIHNKQEFIYHAVDIEIRKPVVEAITGNSDSQVVNLVEQNSLVELPNLIAQGVKFDLIMIDGDHNYYTVIRELGYVDELMHDGSVIIIDDYHGPWGVYDYWYGAEGDSPQKENPLATPKEKADKFGVQTAAHDWMFTRPGLEMFSIANNVLYKHNEKLKLADETLPYCHGVLVKKMSYWPRKSYSQMGEDLVIENNLNFFGLKAETLSYLDIGTNDPCDSNNTYKFYERGGRGVLVEPDEMYWGRIDDKRPDDKLVKACVSDFDSEAADFYIMSAHSLNTMIKATAEHACAQAGYGNQKIEKVVKKPVVNVNRLIEDNFEKWPNLISIDTEGMDAMIVKAIDWKKYKSELVCVEVNEGRDEIISTLLGHGYHIACDNTLNIIFTRRG